MSAHDPAAGEIVWGWKDIARVLGRSVDTAQRLAARNEDPLPVFWEFDRPGAYVQAILHWRARQRCSFKIHREIVALRAEVARRDQDRADRPKRRVRRTPEHAA